MALTERQRLRREDAKLAYAALMKFYPLSLENLDGEEWRSIEGFDKYQISNYGRVKSFWGKTPVIRTPQLLVDYLHVVLYFDGKRKSWLVHVLVARAFIPNPENKPEVNHRVGCKFNCHASNLEWATHAENIQHAVKNSLIKSGVDDSKAKIKNEADIIYIRENPDNLKLEQLAAMFGVKQQRISDIQLGKTYENECGTIRKPQKQRIPDEIRAKIRADWATGQYTKADLARKFGYRHSTIIKILREG